VRLREVLEARGARRGRIDPRRIATALHRLAQFTITRFPLAIPAVRQYANGTRKYHAIRNSYLRDIHLII
jgi:hypothetical protein